MPASNPEPTKDEINAERSILGYLILDGELAIDEVKRLLGTSPTAFNSEAHQCLYGEILARVKQGKPINLESIVSALGESGELGSVGGLAYLTELTSIACYQACLESRTRLVHQCAARIRAHRAIKSADRGLSSSDSLPEILSVLGGEVALAESTLMQNHPGIVKLSEAEPQSAEWVWPGHIPLGKATILDEVTRLLPRFRGKRLHRSTISRWCHKGCQGVRLAYVKAGRSICVTRRPRWSAFWRPQRPQDTLRPVDPNLVPIRARGEDGPALRQNDLENVARRLSRPPTRNFGSRVFS